jgi:myo-inositol-1(or 4)-monophosphatase
MALRLSPHMTVMANAAQKAAKRLLRDFNEVEQLQVSVKGPSDFVSQADIRAEQILKEELTKARPGYSFLMEESGASGSENWAWRWVVDPLDGTTNFLHGIPHWAISIGLERRLPDGTSEAAAGLVYAPVVDELFWAEKGAGAFVNERRLRVSARREIKDAVLATGIPFAAVSATRRLAFARTLGALMPQVAGIRRFGAAALDLAWVAAGRYDGYWELGIKPWDMSAGLLLVREAGGYATDPGGADPRDTGDVVAANPHLHARLGEIVLDGRQAATAHRA